MCGINGSIHRTNLAEQDIRNEIQEMNDKIIHRGPDDDGVYAYSKGNIAVGMGMRRLAIIDLSSGNQPMYSDNKSIALVFNGEIYNYLQLRNTLEQEGVIFKTHSDTEVILRLYEREGVSSFKKLDGMFAFSIHDKNSNRLFIARDFFGEKPLYYANSESGFYWASELKSIIRVLPQKPEISRDGINYFLRLSYIPAPFTIYEGIKKLEANHYLEYNLEDGSVKIREISTYSYPSKQKISFNEAKQKTRELVLETVDSRSISDVPLGTFLSGGVDSSIVSLCLARSKDSKINTFSIGFDKDRYDETDKSRVVAKLIGSKHQEFIIREEEFKDRIHDILVNFDEPFSDTAALPTELLSRKTREQVTVALTGDGGDEVFGGYNKYYIGKMNKRYQNIIPRGLHKAVKSVAEVVLKDPNDQRGRFKALKFLNAVDYDGQFYWDIISLNNSQEQLSEILKPELIVNHIFKPYKERLKIESPTSLTDFRLVDWVLSLEGGMLAKVDRTSMMNSLECRAPFLNKKLWDFTNSLPEEYLLNGWNKKYLLKEAFREDFPKDFLENKKQGFASPVGFWLKNSLRPELESFIEIDFLNKQGIFNPDGVRKLVLDHLNGKKRNSFSVWGFYCFQKWYKYNYEAN
jgi:asparagine synthase (glutamine-hydrolysing)